MKYRETLTCSYVRNLLQLRDLCHIPRGLPARVYDAPPAGLTACFLPLAGKDRSGQAPYQSSLGSGSLSKSASGSRPAAAGRPIRSDRS